MKSRVLTALALLPVVVVAFCFAQPWPLYVLMVAATAVCLPELAALRRLKTVPLPVVGGLATAAAGIAIALHRESIVLTAAIPALVVGIVALRFIPGRLGFELGSLWIVAPLCAIPCLHAGLRPNGFRLDHAAILVILPIWAGDTAAIFAGRLFGKHLLAPAISPAKTWEGAIGNFAACFAAAIFFGFFLHVSLAASAAVGASCAILGQLGDLFESWLKRKAGIKDSGSLLPGHGGLLDRIDSLLFAAAPSCLALLTLR